MKLLDKEHIYYMVYFDGMLASGRKASQKIRDMFNSDTSFKLNQFDKCMEYVNKLRKNKCDYGFYIEIWNEEDESVEHPVHFRSLKHSI
tara:strand:+ start:40 stop:306 length:267 start_codon:yes stop_codon:yes gene_type:complete